MTKVAFQGERGAFSENAVIKFFGAVELLSCRAISEVFGAVSRAEAHFGVVPAENSQAGTINETYDLLLRSDLNIFGEVVLKINHCLIAPPGETIKTIDKVYSHPQALAQCEEFLRKLDVELVPTYDTAGSAKMIRDKGLRNCAAIASEGAAQIYQMEILGRNIQTNPHNYTKFVVISKQEASYTPNSKTSLVFATKNIPGALYASLGAFANRNINLTKLESRPSKDKPWEYLFYVDFEGHIEDQVCKGALEDLRNKTIFLKVLGSYPKS